MSAEQRSGWRKAVQRALTRWGGFLICPRREVGRLSPEEGRHDAWWFGGLYLAGAEIDGLARGLASWASLRDLGGAMMFGAALGRSLLIPIVALTLAEVVLGRSRAYRRAVVLVPLLVGTTGVRGLSLLGVPVAPPTWLVPLAAGAWGMAWIAWIRPIVVPLPAREDEARTPEEGT